MKKTFSPYVLKRLKKDLPEVKTKQDIRPIYLEMSSGQYLLYSIFIRNEIERLKLEYDFLTRRLILQKFRSRL